MKKLLGFCIVLALSFWVVRPLFSAGYFPMHDDTQIARVVVMGKALREGQFPVRWVSDLGYGYGYPIFNFYGPLPYYVGGALYAVGLSGLVATKIMMGLGLVFAGIIMYFALADIIGVSAGVLGAVLYLFAPYHAVQAYVRGAVGEYWSLIFLPCILWGFWKILEKKSVIPGILLGSLGLAGLTLSHTILGYVGGASVAIASISFSLWKRKGYRAVFFILLLGLGLSTFFWLPAITEMKYTNVAGQIGSSANFRDHFVCPSQLWNSVWGFGGSAKGCLDGLSFKIGKIHILTGLIVVLMWLVPFIQYSRKRSLLFTGLVITLVSLFFTLSLSQPVWELLPLFAYIQYPWRFLAFTIFGISFLGAQAVYFLRPSLVRWLAVMSLVGMLLFIEAKRFNPQYTYTRPVADFESTQEIRFRVSKISDEYLPPGVPRPKKEADIVHDTITKSNQYDVEMVEQRDTYEKFAFKMGQEEAVTMQKAYFPGWHYLVNGKEVKPIIENGLPVLILPQGGSVVEMYFSDTPIRMVANCISILSLGVFFYLYDQKNKKTVS